VGLLRERKNQINIKEPSNRVIGVDLTRYISSLLPIVLYRLTHKQLYVNTSTGMSVEREKGCLIWSNLLTYTGRSLDLEVSY